MSSKEYKKIILDKLSETLKIGQFKKKGNIFSLSNGDLTYFIGLQSSQSSTSAILKVTINTEIASSLISKIDDISIPIENQRHYFRRIGSYLKDEPDIWWTIESFEGAKNAAIEITTIIADKVFPNFENLKTTNDLAELWRTGGYIGITERQRKNYLNIIESVNK